VHDALVEGIVVGDDDLMERYLNDETIGIDELARALAAGVASASVFPVLCGSATSSSASTVSPSSSSRKHPRRRSTAANRARSCSRRSSTRTSVT